MIAWNISPLDGEELPNISMIGEIGKNKTIDMEEKEFWECVEYTSLKMRERIMKDRKVALDVWKAKQKTK